MTSFGNDCLKTKARILALAKSIYTRLFRRIFPKLTIVSVFTLVQQALISRVPFKLLIPRKNLML